MNRLFGCSLAGGTLLLASCAQTPVAPTTQVSPGPGKTFAMFQSDDAACKQAAAQSVAGMTQALNNQAVGGAVASALSGGTAQDATNTGVATSTGGQSAIQDQYDKTYANCMFSAGENVAGMEPAEAPPPPEPEAAPVHIVRDPLVQQVQLELIRLSYLHGGADGVSGPRTVAAIRQFETDKSMTVDGTSSHNLLAALKSSQSTANPTTASQPAPAPADTSGKFALPPPPPASQ